jgi:hypothetical protein
MTQIDVMKMALEALVLADRDSGIYSFDIEITALRSAIDRAEKHEPAFWLNEHGQLSATRGYAERHSPGQKLIPLYTEPKTELPGVQEGQSRLKELDSMAKEHNLQDVRCECCGYMTYHREHMGCIRAVQKPLHLTDAEIDQIAETATQAVKIGMRKQRLEQNK